MFEDAQNLVVTQAEEEEENYFISMTDMMVGVLFIFIIMLMTFALSFRTQTDISEEKLKRLQRAADTARSVALQLNSIQSQVREEIEKLDRADQVRAELLQKLRDAMSAEGLKVNVDLKSGVLRLTEAAVRFPVESAELVGEAPANVEKIASVMATVLPAYTAQNPSVPARLETVFIEGHTDKTGNPDKNWLLSTQRAVNTYRALVAKAPSLRNLRNSASTPILSVSGYADSRPVPDVDINLFDFHRRIDLRFVMEVDRGDKLKDVLDLTSRMQGELSTLTKAVESANAP